MALTSLGDYVATEVGPLFCDHRTVYVEMSLPFSVLTPQPRKLWDFATTNWAVLTNTIASRPFQALRGGYASSTVENVTRHILDSMSKVAPVKVLKQKDAMHPWMDAKCVEACDKMGKGALSRVECSRIVMAKFLAHCEWVKGEDVEQQAPSPRSGGG